MQVYFHPEREQDARALVGDHGWEAVSVSNPAAVSTAEPFFLWLGKDALQLHARGDRHGVSLSLQEVVRRAQPRVKSLLARSLGLQAGHSKTILDAMGGFGLDGMLISAWGCKVTILERSPVVFALLLDGLSRFAQRFPQASAPQPFNLDFADYAAPANSFDIVYLDPMFFRRSKVAEPNKRAQYLARFLAAPSQAATEQAQLTHLLCLARGIARERVVLKRRRHDPLVQKPDWQIQGKSVRFDVFRSS